MRWALRLDARELCSSLIVKRFSLPERWPFDVSEGTFSIVEPPRDVDNQAQETALAGGPHASSLEMGGGLFLNGGMNEGVSGVSQTALQSRPSASNREAEIQLLATYDTYYLYSFDGKLLAEYDSAGSCVKDYIYLGSMLIAEFQTSGSKYYYYTSDRINSTRVITDSTGTVVYSAAHDPYGGVQKVWANSYDPKLKFSGKEREADTGWDYFGARYFASAQYRFISTDPVMNRDEAISNPQLWNLYAYCRNNPVTFLDPDGRDNINIFFAFDPAQSGRDSAGNLYPFPDLAGLAKMAEREGHKLAFKNFTKSEFLKSIKEKDTWTIFVGHSVQNRESRKWIGIFANNEQITIAGESLNKYVGIFACQSEAYTPSLFSGPILFAVESNEDRTSAFGLANAAYGALKALLGGADPGQAAVAGTRQMQSSTHPQDRGDRVIYYK